MVTFHHHAFRHHYHILSSTCDTVLPLLFISTTQKTVPSYCSQQASVTKALCKSFSRCLRIEHLASSLRASGPPGSFVPHRTVKAPGAAGQPQNGAGHADGRASARLAGRLGSSRVTTRPPHPALPAAAPGCRTAPHFSARPPAALRTQTAPSGSAASSRTPLWPQPPALPLPAPPALTAQQLREDAPPPRGEADLFPGRAQQPRTAPHPAAMAT